MPLRNGPALVTLSHWLRVAHSANTMLDLEGQQLGLSTFQQESLGANIYDSQGEMKSDDQGLNSRSNV